MMLHNWMGNTAPALKTKLQGSCLERLGAYTLALYSNELLIYSSSESWLYPLLDLEEKLQQSEIIAKADEQMLLYDKITGKAGALLVCLIAEKYLKDSLSFQLHTHLISLSALRFLEERGISCSFEHQITAVNCQTELEFKNIDDPVEGLKKLQHRIRKKTT